MGVFRIFGPFRDRQHVEPDRRTFFRQAHVDGHTIVGVFGPVGCLREAPRVTYRYADIAIGDVGHVFGGVEVGDVRANFHQQGLRFGVVLGIAAVRRQTQVLQRQRHYFGG